MEIGHHVIKPHSKYAIHEQCEYRKNFVMGKHKYQVYHGRATNESTNSTISNDLDSSKYLED